MKRTLLASIALSTMLAASIAQADTMLADIDTSDLIDLYDWDNSTVDQDTNPDLVSPNSLAMEERWLEALLGLAYNNPDVNYIDKFNFDDNGNSFPGFPFDPNFNWDYAIVKIGNAGGNPDHYAFYDTDENNLLNDLVWQNGSTPVVFSQGVSHITFFSGTSEVPEPAAMMLFGSGLAALAGLRSRRKR